MKQRSLANTGFELVTKRTRKRDFLDEMNLVVPWAELIDLITPHAPAGKTGRPPFAVATMLRIHFMQQWFGLSDPAMEEALEANELSQQMLATINATLAAKGLMLKTGTVVDATLIAAPSSTKNSSGERDPEMHQAKKGNQWHFGMKAHIGVDAESGLVHTVIGTAANVNDVTQGHGLLHGEEEVVFADAGYQGAMKRPEATGVDWFVAMRPGKRKALGKQTPWGNLIDKAEQLKASVRAKVEHPFRVVKCQFGFTKVRYKGLVKNTAQLVTLFALSNLWMARKRIVQGLKA